MKKTFLLSLIFLFGSFAQAIESLTVLDTSDKKYEMSLELCSYLGEQQYHGSDLKICIDEVLYLVKQDTAPTLLEVAFNICNQVQNPDNNNAAYLLGSCYEDVFKYLNDRSLDRYIENGKKCPGNTIWSTGYGTAKKHTDCVANKVKSYIKSQK